MAQLAQICADPTRRLYGRDSRLAVISSQWEYTVATFGPIQLTMGPLSGQISECDWPGFVSKKNLKKNFFKKKPINRTRDFGLKVAPL